MHAIALPFDRSLCLCPPRYGTHMRASHAHARRSDARARLGQLARQLRRVAAARGRRVQPAEGGDVPDAPLRLRRRPRRERPLVSHAARIHICVLTPPAMTSRVAAAARIHVFKHLQRPAEWPQPHGYIVLTPADDDQQMGRPSANRPPVCHRRKPSHAPCWSRALQIANEKRWREMQRVLQDHSLLFWNRAARANKLYKANDCTPPRRQPRLDPSTSVLNVAAQWPNLRLLTLTRSARHVFRNRRGRVRLLRGGRHRARRDDAPGASAPPHQPPASARAPA